MPATLADLAARFGCELHGDGNSIVDGVGTLANAGDRALTFLANPQYRTQLKKTRAAAVVIEARYQAECPVAALVAVNPYATYASIARFLHPGRAPKPGIHPTAVVSPDATVAETAQVGAHVFIGPRTQIADAVIIDPGAIIASDVMIGSSTHIGARVAIMDETRIGERCVLYPGAVIGSAGFGYAREEGGWLAVPQLGKVVIGDDVDVGSNTTIDRGAIEDTVIESGVKIDNLVQIAHNAHIGEHTAIAAMAGVAGSTKVGRRCMIGGAVVIVGHISICDDVLVTFHSSVMRSITEPGTYSSGLDADKAARWRRNAARLRRLDDHLRRK
jgi:UDP-3-O-[3-hydroxymyristoyl] glucosamine N-acyltransferase